MRTPFRRAFFIALIVSVAVTVVCGSAHAEALIAQAAPHPLPIVSISPQTGAVRPLFGMGNVFALGSTIDEQGQRLFLLSGSPELPRFVVVDLTTGAVVSHPFPNTAPSWFVTLFEYDPTRDRVIVNASGAGGPDRLYEVHPETGSFELLMTLDLGPRSGLFRMGRATVDFAGRRLFFLIGESSFFFAQPTLFVADLTTGVVTTRFLPPLSFPSFYALLHYDPATDRLVTATLRVRLDLQVNPLSPAAISLIDPDTGALEEVLVTSPIGISLERGGHTYSREQRRLFFLTRDENLSPAQLQLNSVDLSAGTHSVAIVQPYDTNYSIMEFWPGGHSDVNIPTLQPTFLILLCIAMGASALLAMRESG